MENISRSRKNNCRSFQVNIKEDIREIAKFASIHYEIPLYKVVENAIFETYAHTYYDNQEEK